MELTRLALKHAGSGSTDAESRPAGTEHLFGQDPRIFQQGFFNFFLIGIPDANGGYQDSCQAQDLLKSVLNLLRLFEIRICALLAQVPVPYPSSHHRPSTMEPGRPTYPNRIPSFNSSSGSEPEHGLLLPHPSSPFARNTNRVSGSSYLTESRSTISAKFSLTPDPNTWGSSIYPSDEPEPDDPLHDPDPKRDRLNDSGASLLSSRSFSNLGCLIILVLGLTALFLGYPLIVHFNRIEQSRNGGFNLGGINASGQIPEMRFASLIDPDTSSSEYTHKSFSGDKDLVLVFSDEFNTEGRSFYPGDDPYWEASDFHYWGTNNLEWYDPSSLITRNGSLEITLSRVANPESNHNLNYKGGLMTTWNKFCFTGGMFLASVTLPGASNVQGSVDVGKFRSGWAWSYFGLNGACASEASIFGLLTSSLPPFSPQWPYSYDACDVGTLPNQTLNGLPLAATQNGDEANGGVLSYLPGQRLSRCTCKGESHPGPIHKADGTYVGRSAPEIDVIEAQVSGGIGHVSQSGQWGPFNAEYEWLNTTDNYVIYDHDVVELNSYKGGVYQQAASAVAITNQDCYELQTGCSSIYGFEYVPGFDNAYITWINDNQASWTIYAAGLGVDSKVEISARPVPEEPMYLILNLGLSENFGAIDFEGLTFPTTMRVDWVRVYQHEDRINIGCDPEEYPIAAYINEYLEAYTNPNLTTWEQFNQPWLKNSLVDQC
ncbi:hypothetical protein D9758_008336 [Tetrapyrgos nigripes]|uniref:GH16 domain-containing protein n=1 Tax=Tetrapyrgos nigripes TaxID=182062 RepID=A0A8H5LMM3_9AGAR|nr:hypothetical protein D9758_008336 [Tetrapyrgos nigripes]